jgi:TolB-like protein
MPHKWLGGLEMAAGGGDEKTSVSTPSVFISYASLDSASAETACEALEKAGVTCWIAPRDVTPGAFYGDEIVHAIDAAKAIVLILSQNAATSPHVLREVERAASKRHAVISLRIDKAPLPAGLEYFLNTSQWLDASSGGTVRALPKLVSAVQVAIQAPTVMPTGVPTAHAPAPAVSARSRKRMALVVASVVSLALVGFAADRLWLSSHRPAATPATTPVASAPVPVTAAPAIPEKSVAVLPFVDMSEKKDQEYFSDGLSEELIDMLTKIPDLRVPARTSSFYFKGKSEDIPTIARRLMVAHVLEGSVRKYGNHLRVTAQLVRADNGYHLWSETYDRNLADIFKMQDDIAGSVVKALKLKLAPGQQGTSSRRTSNPDAYNQYLLGRQFFERFNDDGIRRAIGAYQKAIQLDPNYAAAYAELAISEYFVADQTGDTAKKQQALVTADKAVALAPDEADGYAVRGFVRFEFAWDWTGAQSDFAKALALNPGDNRFQRRYGQLLGSLGRLPESVAVLKKATELDPLSSLTWTVFGNYLIADRQFAAAEEALRRALEIQPDSGAALAQLGIVQLLKGNPTEALTTFRKRGGEGFSLIGIAMCEHSLGHVKESQHALDQVIAKHAQDFAYEIAEVYAWRGEKDEAFAWLERAFQQRDGGLSDIKDDVLLTSLRGDDRFGAMLRKMQLPE